MYLSKTKRRIMRIQFTGAAQHLKLSQSQAIIGVKAMYIFFIGVSPSEYLIHIIHSQANI